MNTYRLLCLALLLLGCAPRTQLLLGIATDLTTEPDVLERVRFSLLEEGVETQRFEWALADRPELGVQLPGSIAIFSGGAEVRLDVVLTGLLRRGAQIQRRQPYRLTRGQTRLQRLALLRSCIDVVCPGEQTCIDGRCETPSVVEPASDPVPAEEVQCGDSSLSVNTGNNLPIAPRQAACPEGQRCVEGVCRPALSPDPLAPMPLSGDALWASRFGGLAEDAGEAAAVDNGGNVLLTGELQSVANFGGGPLPVPAKQDTFLGKLSSAGTYRWARPIAGPDVNDGRALAVNRTGEVAVAGFVRGAVNFGLGDTMGNSNADAFVARYTPAGAPLWARRFNGSAGNSVVAEVLAVDALGNVIVGGDFQGTVDLGGGPTTARGTDDLFIAKYAAATGAHLWSRTFGSAEMTAGENVFGLAVDSGGDVYASGSFFGTVDAGGGPLVSAGKRDALLVRLDGASGAHRWSLRLGSAGDDAGGRAAAIPGGDVLLSATFEGTIRVGGADFTSAGGRDILLGRFSTAGGVLSARAFGGPGQDVAWDLAADGAGRSVLCGEFEGTINLGGAPLMSAGASDGFVVSFDPTGAHQFSRRLGGPGADVAYGAGLDGGLGGAVLVVGSFTQTMDLGRGLSLMSAGKADVFVVQLAP